MCKVLEAVYELYFICVIVLNTHADVIFNLKYICEFAKAKR